MDGLVHPSVLLSAWADIKTISTSRGHGTACGSQHWVGHTAIWPWCKQRWWSTIRLISQRTIRDLWVAFWSFCTTPFLPSLQKLSSRAVHPFLNQFFRFFSWILVDYPPSKNTRNSGAMCCGFARLGPAQLLWPRSGEGAPWPGATIWLKTSGNIVSRYCRKDNQHTYRNTH
jgi:hypothetical protein